MRSSVAHTVSEYQEVLEVRIDPQTGFKGLFTNRSYRTGEEIVRFEVKSIHEQPTYLTVQLAEDKHFVFEPEYLQYLNHHCEPNVHLNLEGFSLIALKPIEAGEELYFFYPSTEWKMDRPFDCHCGAQNCLGIISGAHTLSTTQLPNYQLSPYIQQKLTNQLPN